MKNSKLLISMFGVFMLGLTSCGSKSNSSGTTGGSNTGTTDTTPTQTTDSSNDTTEVHEHNVSTSWTTDETNHWHTCDGCDEVFELGAHTFGEYRVIKEANFEETGLKERKCTVCEKSETEVIEVLQHNYSTNWSHDKSGHWHACTDVGYSTLKKDYAEHTYCEPITVREPNYDREGQAKVICTICEYVSYVSIPKLELTYSDEWSTNEYGHWHACTVPGYESSYNDYAEHTFGEVVVGEDSTFEQTGTATQTCSVCGYVKNLVVPVKEHNYSNEWTSDETGHYHACTDEGYEMLKSDEQEHTWDEAQHEEVESTCKTQGHIHDVCSVCGYVKDVELELSGHSIVYGKDDFYHYGICENCDYSQGSSGHTCVVNEDGLTESCSVCGLTRPVYILNITAELNRVGEQMKIVPSSIEWNQEPADIFPLRYGRTFYYGSYSYFNWREADMNEIVPDDYLNKDEKFLVYIGPKNGYDKKQIICNRDGVLFNFRVYVNGVLAENSNNGMGLISDDGTHYYGNLFRCQIQQHLS